MVKDFHFTAKDTCNSANWHHSIVLRPLKITTVLNECLGFAVRNIKTYSTKYTLCFVFHAGLYKLKKMHTSSSRCPLSRIWFFHMPIGLLKKIFKPYRQRVIKVPAFLKFVETAVGQKRTL